MEKGVLYIFQQTLTHYQLRGMVIEGPPWHFLLGFNVLAYGGPYIPFKDNSSWGWLYWREEEMWVFHITNIYEIGGPSSYDIDYIFF